MNFIELRLTSTKSENKNTSFLSFFATQDIKAGELIFHEIGISGSLSGDSFQLLVKNCYQLDQGRTLACLSAGNRKYDLKCPFDELKLSDEQWNDCCAKVINNGVGNKSTDLFSFFPHVGCFQHSCWPNAGHACLKTNEITVYAISTIKRDEQICISFVDYYNIKLCRDLSSWGILNCPCPRCVDSEHFGNTLMESSKILTVETSPTFEEVQLLQKYIIFLNKLEGLFVDGQNSFDKMKQEVTLLRLQYLQRGMDFIKLAKKICLNAYSSTMHPWQFQFATIQQARIKLLRLHKATNLQEQKILLHDIIACNSPVLPAFCPYKMSYINWYRTLFCENESTTHLNRLEPFVEQLDKMYTAN
jgi:hypothetical protein